MRTLLLMSMFLSLMFIGAANAEERSFIGKTLDSVDKALGTARKNIKSTMGRPENGPIYGSEEDTSQDETVENVAEEVSESRTEPLVYREGGIRQEDAIPHKEDNAVKVETLQPLN